MLLISVWKDNLLANRENPLTPFFIKINIKTVSTLVEIDNIKIYVDLRKPSIKNKKDRQEWKPPNSLNLHQ